MNFSMVKTIQIREEFDVVHIYIAGRLLRIVSDNQKAALSVIEIVYLMIDKALKTGYTGLELYRLLPHIIDAVKTEALEQDDRPRREFLRGNPEYHHAIWKLRNKIDSIIENYRDGLL